VAVLNGGTLTTSWGYIGYYGTAKYNTVLVDGTNSVWTTGGIDLFTGGTYNAITVSNNGKINFNGAETVKSSNNAINVNSGGVLSASGLTLGSNTLYFNGGTLQAKGTGGASVSGAGGIVLVGPGTVDTNTFASTISSVIAGPGALTKSGVGTLTLTGANTYTGATTISNGTLKLTGTGSIASSPIIDVASLGIFDVSTVTGGYTLGAGQTLKGYGTVIGPMTAAGTVAPGSSTGVLSVTGDATLNGTFSVDVETGGASDLLAVSGNLALGPASILSIVNILQLNLAKSPYTIATYGTQSGTFAGGTNLPGAWTVDYGVTTPNAITLVPEPATLALMALGGLGLILGRKRR